MIIIIINDLRHEDAIRKKLIKLDFVYYSNNNKQILILGHSVSNHPKF